MKDGWKKQMQQKMADYRESDVEPTWAELEQTLAASRSATIRPLWLRRVAAVAAIVVLAGAGYWALHDGDDYPEERKVLTEVAKQVESAVSQMATEPSGEKRPETPTIAQATARQQVVTQPAADSAQVFVQPTEADAVEQREAEASPEATEDTVARPTYTVNRPTVVYPSDLKRPSARDSRLTAKVYFSNAMAGGSVQRNAPLSGQGNSTNLPQTTQSDNPGKSDGTPVTQEEIQNPTGYTTNGTDGKDVKDGADDNGDQEQDEGEVTRSSARTESSTAPNFNELNPNQNVSHHQPIRIGLSLRYQLNSHWSIESGLTYTRLLSDFNWSQAGRAMTTEQTLTYIGIPVRAAYQLWGSRYFSLYLSAGALLEQMVACKRSSEGQTVSIGSYPMQFSLDAAAGAEFRLGSQFGLYVEPTLSYYFDNGSQIPTIYQEKPFDFGFTVGLRFSFR